MNCILIDDEPLALDILSDYVQKIPFLNLKYKCNNAFEALEVIRDEKIDLIFCDIQMPNVSGIDFIKSLDPRPMVIFTTAYSKYAVEGFDLNVVDYLLKPIPFDRFLKAVNKANELLRLKKLSKQSNLQSNPAKETLEYILVKSEYATRKIFLDDILFIEGLKDYLKIFTGEKPILTLNSLKKIEEKLPGNQFVRVHRSYIIALNKIDSIQRNRILIGNTRIPIGDNYKEHFFSRIEKNNL